MDILDELPEAGPEALAVLEEFRAGAREKLPLEDEAYEKFCPWYSDES